MAYIIIARQRMLVVARNTQNNTTSITGRVALVVNPLIVIEKETVDNPIFLKDLNHRRL
jgi:hypothetical protein